MMNNKQIEVRPTQHRNLNSQHVNLDSQSGNLDSQHGNLCSQNVELGVERLNFKSLVSLCFLFAATLFGFTSAQASNKTADILLALSQNIKSAPSISMDFEMIVSNPKVKSSSTGISSNNDSYSGSVLAAGDSYKLVNPQFELYCDGRSKWMVNHSEKEITVFQHDASQMDIVENPLGFFTSVSKGYDYSERSKREVVKNIHSQINGKEVWIINLKPKSTRAPYKTIKLGIDPATNQPLLVTYTSKDGSVYTIIIKKFTRLGQPLPQSTFKLPQQIPSDYKTNDLR